MSSPPAPEFFPLVGAIMRLTPFFGGAHYYFPPPLLFCSIIALVGWGEGFCEATGRVEPYWVLRNSWGTPWGEGGWMRIARGYNVLGVESGCNWGVPAL